MPSYFKLGSDEHGRGADELQRLPHHLGDGQVMIRQLHRQVQSLVVQLEVFLRCVNNNNDSFNSFL